MTARTNVKRTATATPKSAPIVAEANAQLASTQPDNGSPANPDARADPERLGAMLESIARISEPGPGVTRLAYSPLEREAHELVRSWGTQLGLHSSTDAVGNTIIEIPGADPDLPAIATGSHLDSVPHGGRFDGVAGVVAAFEAARVLAERGTALRHPLRLVVFAAEEGARFGQACIGSMVLAGRLDEVRLRNLFDENGLSAADAMERVGLRPSELAAAKWSSEDWACFLELHIEQGNLLDTNGIPVGIVDLVSGSTRLAIDCHGRATHTGSTPMRGRSDALAAAAEIVLLTEDIATDARHRGARATVGKLEVRPGSITTIAGQVSLTIDVRDIDSDRQRSTAREIWHRAQESAARRQVALTATVIGDSSPVVLPIWLRSALAESTAQLGFDYRMMTSGASHDCQMVNHVVPAGLLFIPSRGGLSHVPDEFTSTTDLAVGVDVLVQALQNVDRMLAEQRAAIS
jgi:hydantoinase/carbamoylase family amidase